MSISAKIIADSLNEYGNRLTTYVLTYPRIIHAEFMTHRMISKNSASSRAIPFKKMVKMVEENPFIPIRWMKDHSGMQGNEYYTDEETINNLKEAWLIARDKAVDIASHLNDCNVTKQICNRLLEPFMWHTVICTGSEWSNFFALRANDQAEIHIQDLAFKMLEAYNASEPKQLKAGEYHIPFGDSFDEKRLGQLIAEKHSYIITPNDVLNSYKVKIAVARCARISYLNFEGKDDYEADIKLFDRLSGSGHYSPFEHCAKAMSAKEMHSYVRGIDTDLFTDRLSFNVNDGGWCGNFRGFIQLRKTLQGENKTDNRVITK